MFILDPDFFLLPESWIQRSKRHQIPDPQHCPYPYLLRRYLDSFDGGLTSADESRPMSEADLVMTDGGLTDASSWIAAGGSVTLRRNAAASRSARPLTRYLPVTGQENFDLRAHIESAGHQVGFRFRSQSMFFRSSFFFNAHPDPEFYLYADPDPGSRNNAHPDRILVRHEFLVFWVFCVLHLTLLHLPPPRLHSDGGCWDRTQDCCDYSISRQTL
jgi:hypothetical protein